MCFLLRCYFGAFCRDLLGVGIHCEASASIAWTSLMTTGSDQAYCRARKIKVSRFLVRYCCLC